MACGSWSPSISWAYWNNSNIITIIYYQCPQNREGLLIGVYTYGIMGWCEGVNRCT